MSLVTGVREFGASLRIRYDMIDDWELFLATFQPIPNSALVEVRVAWLESQGIPGGALPLDILAEIR